jgi:hypothetical protein
MRSHILTNSKSKKRKVDGVGKSVRGVGKSVDGVGFRPRSFVEGNLPHKLANLATGSIPVAKLALFVKLTHPEGFRPV